MILQKKQGISDFVVTFPLGESSYAETYRIKDRIGKNYFLKLIDCTKLHHTQFDNGNILELEITNKLNQENIVSYHDSGELLIEGKRYLYIVYEFIAGETVSQKTAREQRCSVYAAKQIVLGVLQALKYLHELDRPIIHNDITSRNVMLDLSKEPPVPKLIDFDHARYLDQKPSSFMLDGLNLLCVAPEALNGVFSVQSDLYSVGVMLYHLLFGIYPFYVDVEKYKTDKNTLISAIVETRQHPLRVPTTNKFEMDENLLNTMMKAMSFSVDDRFSSAEEFMKALNGEIKIEKKEPKHNAKDVEEEDSTKTHNIKKGNGFKDVAGMSALKEQLQSDVIELIKNPKKAKELGLSMPNGLLFYGPPGCGKTFFAEKFAEEAGFNYKYVKCSDVASPYIHGGQGKIAAIFDEARKNAPTILFFDEIDAMIKDRSKHTNVSEAGEVNEFLAQLNNCGEDGVLVIGATNKPSEIDEAALRAGRLEFKYYIPQPDKETRALIFEINLSKRRCDFGINYDHLADMTENYISADIKMIVDNAARLTFRRKEDKILQSTIEEVISETKPSLTLEAIKKHEAIRDEFLGIKKVVERNRIGFK